MARIERRKRDNCRLFNTKGPEVTFLSQIYPFQNGHTMKLDEIGIHLPPGWEYWVTFV